MTTRPTKRRSAARAIATAGALLAASFIGARANAQAVPEDSVKAAFLYRFADYVDWPAPALQSAQFTFAVLDDPQVAADLGRMVAGHQVKGHTPQVKLIHHAKEAADAQIVFVGPGDPDAHRSLIAALTGHPVLVVTDEEHGLEEGSTVNFMLVDRRLRFEISLTAAGHSGLRISSELLSVAARVEGHLRSNANCARCPLTVATQ